MEENLWTVDLTTGSDNIDKSHTELMRNLYEALERIASSSGQDIVKDTIQLLFLLFKMHFHDEESLQNEVAQDSPHNIPHKEDHSRFLNQLSELKERFQAEGETGKVSVQKVFVELAKQYKRHMEEHDSKLSEILFAKELEKIATKLNGGKSDETESASRN